MTHQNKATESTELPVKPTSEFVQDDDVEQILTIEALDLFPCMI